MIGTIGKIGDEVEFISGDLEGRSGVIVGYADSKYKNRLVKMHNDEGWKCDSGRHDIIDDKGMRVDVPSGYYWFETNYNEIMLLKAKNFIKNLKHFIKSLDTVGGKYA